MRPSDSIALKAALFLLSYSVSVSAFWRMPCKGRTGLARIDPLVSPGEIAEHAHAVHGGSGKLTFVFSLLQIWGSQVFPSVDCEPSY
jgi:hypothetical protein